MLDADDRLRLDYDQTNQLLRTLLDVRFKLLAFVPTVSGLAVALLGRPRPAAELVGVGLLGLTATLGILVYELRNSQLLDTLVDRAVQLEQRLGLASISGTQGAGGIFSERPPHSLRVGGLLSVGHARGTSLVYAAALAGWTYLVAWGTLGALEVPESRGSGAVIGAAVGLLVLVGIDRGDRTAATAPPQPS